MGQTLGWINAKVIGAALLVAGLVLGTVAVVAADDETDDVAMRLQAPLDATACDATPPTVTVLGLVIDVSTASIDATGGSDGESEGEDDGADGQAAGQGGCRGLVVGQGVEVALASDAVPLVATAVANGGDGEPKLQGPVQAVDPTLHTITVLGLVIDVSAANLDGADDDATDGASQAIDLATLMPGQIAEVQSDPSRLPALVATELQVKNFTNQVAVEVDDTSGEEVDDVDDSGAEMDDVSVDVSEMVLVQTAATTATGRAVTRRARKVLTFHRVSNGSVQLSGLPTGVARVVATRVHDGVTTTARRAVVVRGNQTRTVRVRLHKVRTR
jgi:hypothetical protein